MQRSIFGPAPCPRRLLWRTSIFWRRLSTSNPARFGYLDHTGVAAFLSAVAGALKPQAKLVIATGMTAESILPTLVQKRWHRLDDLVVLSQNRYDPWESRLDIDYTFVRGSSLETGPTESYVFTAAELRRMLNAAGFDTLSFQGSAAGEPYRLGSPRLIIIAQRR